MLLGTPCTLIAPRAWLVSIPREDSCFWERRVGCGTAILSRVSIPREDSCFWEQRQLREQRARTGFNPQRGFMLLGTKKRGDVEQKNCCFNPQRGFMLLGTSALAPAGNRLSRFNPQRGFMLLGTFILLSFFI